MKGKIYYIAFVCITWLFVVILSSIKIHQRVIVALPKPTGACVKVHIKQNPNEVVVFCGKLVTDPFEIPHTVKAQYLAAQANSIEPPLVYRSLQ